MMATALAKKPTPQPKYKPPTDPTALQAQITSLQKEVDRRGGAAKAPQFAKRLQAAQNAQSSNARLNPTAPAPGVPPDPQEQNYDNAASGISGAVGNLANQIGSMQPFNPGSFADQQNAAYGHVMDQFTRTQQPQFDQQAASFRQRMLASGVDPSSQEYQQRYQNEIAGPQEQARQNAMDSAYGQGLSAQAQGYGQAASAYQMPFQQMQALSPGFDSLARNQSTQATLEFQGSQNALDRQQQAAMAAQQQHYQMQQMQFAAAHRAAGGGGGGGGGMTLQDQMALQNNQFYNNMALMAAQGGQQAPGPSIGSGFAQGVGAGIGAGVTGMLR